MDNLLNTLVQRQMPSGNTGYGGGGSSLTPQGAQAPGMAQGGAGIWSKPQQPQQPQGPQQPMPGGPLLHGSMPPPPPEMTTQPVQPTPPFMARPPMGGDSNPPMDFMPHTPSRVPPAWQRFATGQKMQQGYKSGWQPNPMLTRVLNGGQ